MRLALASSMLLLLYIFTCTYQSLVKHTPISLNRNAQQQMDTLRNFGPNPLKRIVFLTQTNYHRWRGILKITRIQQCEYSNCVMSFKESDVNKSDAVILDMKRTRNTRNQSLSYMQNQGQIWIWSQLERPTYYDEFSTPEFRSRIRGFFNWTMTYSKRSDIYLPYGILKEKNQAFVKRDYLEIAQKKTRDALWVSSHCNTPGKRENYIDILKSYVNVDVLGKCGEKWNCGRRHDHDRDNCFDILNTTYRFYFAFENGLCQEYITEKFFDNFDYDTLVVSRGDVPGSRAINISNNAYINAGDYTSAHKLGEYLRKLSNDSNLYAEMLEVKDRYYVMRYKEVYKEAMCTVCKRLNNVDKYRYVYEDIHQWMETNERCITTYNI